MSSTYFLLMTTLAHKNLELPLSNITSIWVQFFSIKEKMYIYSYFLPFHEASKVHK